MNGGSSGEGGTGGGAASGKGMGGGADSAAGQAGEDGGRAARGPVCGNGKLEEGEACDDGVDNGLTLLACAPDCSRVIEVKHIVVGASLVNDYFAPDPVATVDVACPDGYKALFAYGSVRRATTIPFKTVNPVDWVLRPYTYYYNVNENPIWLTRDVAMLGVEDGMFVGLENPIAATSYVFVSNLNLDGTTLTNAADNCSGWASMDRSQTRRCGFSPATDETYLFDEREHCLTCGWQVNVYCVEQ